MEKNNQENERQTVKDEKEKKRKKKWKIMDFGGINEGNIFKE